MSVAEQIQTIEAIEKELAAVLTPAQDFPEGEEPTNLEVLNQYSFSSEEVCAIIHKIRETEAIIEFLKNEVKRLQSKHLATENRLREFKDHIARIFEQEEISKIRSEKGTLYIRKSTSVEIHDLDQLPPELVQTVVEFRPKKKEAKEQLNQGVVIPGAELVEKKVLCIK